MRKIVYPPAVLLSIGLLAASLGQWIFFRATLQSMEDRTARVAYQALNRILLHAHRMEDDLTLQEAIQGFSRAPGLLFACVVDPDNKVVAHTQPVQLGKIFTRPRRSRAGLKAFTLQDAEKPWGRLILGFSSRFSRMKSLIEAVLLFGLNLCVWGPVLWMLQRCLAARRLEQKHVDTLEFQCAELQRDLERLRLTEENHRARWNVWMETALERMSRPAFFLDPTQRLAACNRAARERLGIADEPGWRGRSWQDLPALSACGEVLQRSLERPGEAATASLAGAPVEFLSEKAHGGTWILFN